VGDTVDIGDDAKGQVEELTLRVTKVRDVNGTLWHVPNGQIKRVANKSQEWARAVLDIEVDGATRYEAAAALIQKVAEGMASEERWLTEMVETPEVWGVESFTEAGYIIRTVARTRPASQFRVMRELRIRLLDAFQEGRIVLPGAHWAIEHPVPDPDTMPEISETGASANGSSVPVDGAGDAGAAPPRARAGGRGRRATGSTAPARSSGSARSSRSASSVEPPSPPTGVPAVRPGAAAGAEPAGPEPDRDDGAAEEEA
jgi:small conductance mechanosensitive channel